MKIILCACISLAIASAAAQEAVPLKLTAPTYFISVRAHTCDPDEVRFSGASNLPAGAKLEIKVSDAYRDAWQDYSDYVYVALGPSGFFDGVVHPKKGMTFHRNLALLAIFTTYSASQSSSVLTILGHRGENLGGLRNPQVYQISGQYFLLQSIDRVPFCGEGLRKPG